MIQTTYAELYRPSIKSHSIAYNAMLVIGGSLLIALCAQLSFYLPFSPVPVTMQTFAVILTGALLGNKRGVTSVAAYLTEGALGLPVFAGGKMGLVVLMGPTGGYLLGFLAAAFITGYLAERGWDRKYWSMALAMTLGTALIFIFGLAWLSIVLKDGPLLKIGLFPFIPGAIVKIGLATLLLPTGWKLLKKTKRMN